MNRYDQALLLPLLTLFTISLCLSCGSSQQLRKSLNKQVAASPVFNQSFTGFTLYDPEKKVWLAEQFPDRYFTPASNTKILTFYASILTLKESLPALVYTTRQDSLIFWGTGHPGFLHPDLPPDTTVFQFLQNWSGPLFFSTANYMDQRYGEGWMWDDFPYAFQAEKSSFPIYGNTVSFTVKKGRRPSPDPSYFLEQLTYSPKGSWINRAEYENQFTYNGQQVEGRSRRLPFRYDDSLLVQLLSDTLNRPVHLSQLSVPQEEAQVQTFPSQQAPDSLYRLLLQDSDNFIAEQLLLLCSHQQGGALKTQSIIDSLMEKMITMNPPVWVDGSGVSRYNMLTPRSLVQILEQLWNQLDHQRLLNLFPAGGVSGTIRNRYAGKSGPYIFAKTGTLRHNHCLSGYLQTKSGKWLIFSFMHNHFPGSSREVQNEMELVLAWIREHY